MLIRDFNSEELRLDYFHSAKGQAWCILGDNRSGINSFFALLSGELPESPNCILTEKPAVISFRRQQEIFEEELRKDNTDFAGRLDPGTPARAFLHKLEHLKELVRAFNLQDCLDKGFRQLSTGEGRKLMLLSAISENPSIILIENPYEGLDTASCLELDNALEILHQKDLQIIVTVNNYSDIPKWCSHLAVLSGGHIALQGPMQDVIDRSSEIIDESRSTFEIEIHRSASSRQDCELIALSNGFARYGGTEIFSNLNLTVSSAQHTLLTGPNGSGKSTLLQIITGDNQNCYANALKLFGKERGTGESIWEIKKQMGIVSPDLHRNHYIPGSALQVVLSGLFDSIGVYTQCSESQRQDALRWLQMIGLADKAKVSFRQLSYADQRLCLIARALIKMPQLLILDEPTQGLDQNNRNSLLDVLERVAYLGISTILYASHRSDEYRSFFKQHIDLSQQTGESHTSLARHN